MSEQNLDSMIKPVDSEPVILSRGNTQLSVVSLPENKIPWLRFWLEGILFSFFIGFPIGFLVSKVIAPNWVITPNWVLTPSGYPINGYVDGEFTIILKGFVAFLVASAYVALRVWFWRKRP